MKRQKPVATSWHRENDNVVKDTVRTEGSDVPQQHGSFGGELLESSSQSMTHNSIDRNGGRKSISDEAERNSPFRLSQTSVKTYSRSPSGESSPVWHTGISGGEYPVSNTLRGASNGQNQNRMASNLPSVQPDSGFESGKNFADEMDVFDCDGDDDAEDTDGPPLAPASPEMEHELGLHMVCSRFDTRRREMAERQNSSETNSSHPSVMSFDSWSDAALSFGARRKVSSMTNQGNGTEKNSGDKASEDKYHSEDKTPSDFKTRERAGRSDRIQSFTSWSEADSSKSLPSNPDRKEVKGRPHPIEEDHSLTWSIMPNASNINTLNAREDEFLPSSLTRGAGTENNGAKSKLNLKDRLLATFSPTPKRSTPQSMTQSLVGSDDVRNIRQPHNQGNNFHYVGLNRGHGGGNFFTIPANGIRLPDNYGQQVDQSEKLKTKVMSFWNNMKYGWTVKTSTTFSDDKPLFLLGKCYHRKINESESEEGQTSSVDQFKQDFISRIWFTYRREFPQLAGSTFTTDCGWGCMLRSGQMMLSQALVLHFLGRDWLWHAPQTFEMEAYHRQIVKWFGDLPSDHNPFSVHRLVRFGEKCLNKKPGDWYGPASVAHIMKDAIEKGAELNPLLGKICLYIAQDCTVYIEDVVDLCMSRPSDTSSEGGSYEDSSAQSEDTWRSLIILIPIRLGGETLNPIYIPCVQGLFALDSCIGIIGGRPKHSLYFVGWQGDKLIHLDPHYCQDVVDMNKRNFPLNTYHCISPRKMSFTRMDPSCTIGFYCRTKEDFFNFVKTTKQIVAPPMQSSPYPMFICVDGRSSDENQSEHTQKEDRYVRLCKLDEFGRIRSMSHSSDDYVFL